MAAYAANNVTTWFAGYDMTGDLNQVAMPIEYEPLDNTTFGTAAVPRVGRSRQAGLEDVQSTVNGFWQAGTGAVDPEVFNGLGGAAQPLTHTPDGAEGSVAYFFPAKKFSYQLFGDIGQVTPFSLTAMGSKSNGSTGAIRGRVLVDKGDISATGATGSVYELGAITSAQYLYVAVHCFAVGTTFTLQIQSDDAANFPSATTRMTVGPITSVGGTWATRVAGPVTDTFWRVNVFAITGTSTIAVAAGIK